MEGKMHWWIWFTTIKDTLFCNSVWPGTRGRCQMGLVP